MRLDSLGLCGAQSMLYGSEALAGPGCRVPMTKAGFERLCERGPGFLKEGARAHSARHDLADTNWTRTGLRIVSSFCPRATIAFRAFGNGTILEFQIRVLPQHRVG